MKNLQIPSAHPDVEDLELYLLNRPDAYSKFDLLEEHLLWCEKCQDLCIHLEHEIACIRIAAAWSTEFLHLEGDFNERTTTLNGDHRSCVTIHFGARRASALRCRTEGLTATL